RGLDRLGGPLPSGHRGPRHSRFRPTVPRLPALLRRVPPVPIRIGGTLPGEGGSVDDLGDIIQEFLVESHENLDQLDSDLVALEQQPQSRELISSIFRTIHTIKLTSGFLAFTKLEAV